MSIYFQASSCSLNNSRGLPVDPGCPNETVHGTPGGFQDDPIVKLLRDISEQWISFPLIIFGIVGNILSLIILFKHRQRQKLRTILILLRTLAVFDTLVLISMLLVRTIRYIGPEEYLVGLTWAYPYLYPTVYILRLINTWITVLLTVDRYVAVCRPLHAQRLCTIRRTYLQIGGVILFSIIFCIPRYCEYYIKRHPDGHYGFQMTPLISNKLYTVLYRISLFLIVHYLIPTILLVLLNATVIGALRTSDAYRTANMRHRLPRYALQSGTVTATVGQPAANVSPSAFQSTRSVTIVVIVVVCLCIVCHVVAIVAQLMHTVELSFQNSVVRSPAFVLARRHISQVSNVLVTFNSAINFVVYCMCSRTFRAILVSQFCCCLRPSRNGQRLHAWCCRNVRMESMFPRVTHPTSIGPQSSSITNQSTRSMTNSIMLSLMSNKVTKKKDSLRDDSHPDITPYCGPSRNHE